MGLDNVWLYVNVIIEWQFYVCVAQNYTVTIICVKNQIDLQKLIVWQKVSCLPGTGTCKRWVLHGSVPPSTLSERVAFL